VAIDNFLTKLKTLLATAGEFRTDKPAGKPEENTKDKLITPFLEALGYSSEERTFEGTIKTLTSEWVDYFLLPEKRRAPWLMVEAKPFWDKGLWETNKEQVLRYMRDYSLMVAGDAPINWLVLTNFNEWHVLRLNDREPFWSFTAENLKDEEFARRVYECFAREEIPRDRLLSRYQEGQREKLGERFLRDLKTWRVVLANGLRQSHPDLSLEELRGASHTILLRFLFIRLLETYGRERYYSLGTLFDMWRKAFQSLPFSQSLQAKFRDTWASYNTELFGESWVDALSVPNEHLELLILPDAVPDPTLVPLLEGQILGYRSVYNYDFSTLTQDVLGVAYEQFLAHELVDRGGVIQVLDSQETRKREGVFYTPDYIVRHIVRRALKPQVQPHLEEALSRLETGDYDGAYDAASRILEVRVLDPACGSGSFLLGAFAYLTDALERYNRAAQETYQKSWRANGSGDLFSAGAPATPPKVLTYPHERVLVGCLYGVDLDPQAVGLAKLSLWTQLLRAHPGQYGKRGAPHAQLPALTLNIRSGNSLIDGVRPPLGSLDEHGDTLEEAAQLARKAKDVDLSAQARTEMVSALEASIHRVNEALLPNLLPFFASDEVLREAIALVNSTDSGVELDTDSATLEAVRDYLITGKKPKVLAKVDDETLRDVLDNLKLLEEALEDARKKRPFNWPVEFPDVFDPALPEEKRGFTAIVGNPPYFNVDATFGRGAAELDWLRTCYPEIYADKTDILFYFFARGFHVLRSGGDLSFIVSRSFLQGDKSRKLRAFLSQKTTLLSVLDFLGHQVFRAGIATAIIHWRKGEVPEGHELTMDYVMDFDVARGQLEKDAPPTEGLVRVEVAQAGLGEGRWVLSPYREIFRRLDGAGQPLRELAKLGQGMQTGENDVFVLAEVQAKRLGIPATHLKLRASNENLRRFGAVNQGEYVLWVEDTDFSDLPKSVQGYLEKHRTVLEGRAAYQRGNCAWYQFTWPLHADVHFATKIMMPYRAHENVFAVDESGEWLGLTNTTHVFCKDSPVDAYALCALLNSQVLNFRYRALGGLGKLTGKGMFEYFENQVGDLPIPELSGEDETRLGELSRAAHALFRRRYALVEAYKRVLGGQLHQETSFWSLHDPARDYGGLVSYSSPDPNRVGHLLGLRVEATERGYVLWGEVTEEEDWREGERMWDVLAEVEVAHEALRRTLLFRAHYLTEFDDSFRRRQRFTQGKGERVLEAALRALSVPLYDPDAVRNLRVLENLEKRVMESAAGETLEQVMLAFKATEAEIDGIAYRVYGVEAHREEIEGALKLVL